MTKLTVTFRYFAKAPKNGTCLTVSLQGLHAQQRVLKRLRVQQVATNAILTEFSRKRTQSYEGYGKQAF